MSEKIIVEKPIEFDPITKNYFRTILTKSFSDLVIGSFFVVFIYRVTESVQLTIIGLVIYYMGIFAGSMIASLLSTKTNILNTLRLSFFSFGVIYFLLILFWANFSSWAFLFTFIWGCCSGTYFLSLHVFNISVVGSHDKRHQIIYSTMGVTRILGTILPVISGFLINESGYPLVFGITGIVFFIGSSFPYKLKIEQKDIFAVTDMRKTVHLSHYKEYALYTFISAFFNEIRNYGLFLIPFFFLDKNEFNLGLFISLIALTTGIITYLFRKKKRNVTEKYSIAGGIFMTFINFIFGIFWTPLALILRSVLMPIGELFFNPQSEGDEYILMQQLLQKRKYSLGIEFQLIREFLFFVARASAGALFLFLLFIYTNDYMELGQHLTIGFAIWPLMGFLLRKYFIDSLHEEKRY